MAPSTLRRRNVVALAGSALLPVAALCGPLQRESRALFGSTAELLLAGTAEPNTLEAVWAGLHAMNERWNAWKPQGLGPLNRALREGRAVTVTPALKSLIDGAARLEALSQGHFNAAIGAVVQAWGFHSDRRPSGSAPSARDIERWTAARPSLSQLSWRALELRSANPRLQLDFGGYAKGVAVDWALDRLQQGGAQGAVVNLGGNLATTGGLQGRAWRIGIRDPADPGAQVAQLATRGREAVVTSGTYERYRVLDGQTCSHLIDPASGRPAQGLVSVTVVHRQAALADACATALLVAGADRWQALAARMQLDQVLVIHASGLAQVTPRLASRLLVARGWRRAIRVV